MYFLVTHICEMDSLGTVWSLVGWVINTIWVGVPILLIILGMVDLGKAVISSKEDEVKKATKTLGRRFLYAVAVFAVVWLVMLVFEWIAMLGLKDTDTTSWQKCWCQIRNNCK